ncbi:MAG: chemotaxis protein CheD [Clostridium sp.]
MDKNEIKVGIGDLNVTSPPDKIITLGLGSCIGIAMYDSLNKVAGLAHIMLPSSIGFSNQSNPLKFADLALPSLLEGMLKKGANKKNIRAKIAGGASMFSFGDKSSIADIGKRNGISVKEILVKMNIPIMAEDLGGSSGRTMIIESVTGKVFIRTVGKGTKEL